jgi:hypothetical protein
VSGSSYSYTVYVYIYRISQGLWFNMIQWLECFLSPSLGKGIENAQRIGLKSHQSTNHGRFFLYILPHTCFSFIFFFGLYIVNKLCKIDVC